MKKRILIVTIALAVLYLTANAQGQESGCSGDTESCSAGHADSSSAERELPEQPHDQRFTDSNLNALIDYSTGNGVVVRYSHDPGTGVVCGVDASRFKPRDDADDKNTAESSDAGE